MFWADSCRGGGLASWNGAAGIVLRFPELTVAECMGQSSDVILGPASHIVCSVSQWYFGLCYRSYVEIYLLGFFLLSIKHKYFLHVVMNFFLT